MVAIEIEWMTTKLKRKLTLEALSRQPWSGTCPLSWKVSSTPPSPLTPPPTPRPPPPALSSSNILLLRCLAPLGSSINSSPRWRFARSSSSPLCLHQIRSSWHLGQFYEISVKGIFWGENIRNGLAISFPSRTCRWCPPWCYEERRLAHCPQSVVHCQTCTAGAQYNLCKNNNDDQCYFARRKNTFETGVCGWCGLEVSYSQRLRHFLESAMVCTQNYSAATLIAWNWLFDEPVNKMFALNLW